MDVRKTEDDHNVASGNHITFQDLGIPIIQNTRRTFCGNVRTCSSLKRTEIMFLLLSVVSFLVSLGMTIQRLIILEKTSDDYTFAILMLVTTSFCLYYAVDGIFLERLYEILVCVISIFIVIIYCILNYAYGAQDTLKMVRLITALILGSGIIVSGICIAWDYHKHSDLIYRTVGANIELQKGCRILFKFSSLLGLDFQFEISMIIFVMTNGTKLSTLETVILSVGVPFAIVWLILGCFSMRLESKSLCIVFLVTSVLEPGYIIYKFITLPLEDSDTLRYSVIACGIAALVVRFLLFVVFIFAIRNFDKGLKSKLFGGTTNNVPTNNLYH